MSKRRNEDEIDMLSSLPDSILCHIISELKTKEAVRTSLLSSRYKSLWMNITSLNFACEDFKDDYTLNRLLNRVLIFLKSKSINKFRLRTGFLRTGNLCDVYDIPTLVSVAIYKNVKVLKLIILFESKEAGNGISIPACLYTSHTLEDLEISTPWYSGLSLNVPGFVSLPKLTTLKLRRVNYSSDESVRRLISGCSSLERLNIERDRFNFDGVRSFTIDSPTLKSLIYIFVSHNRVIGPDFPFELNAPALKAFVLYDSLSSNFSVGNLCSLENATIRVESWKAAEIDTHNERVVQLIRQLSNLNHLWISGDALEALSHAPSLETSSSLRFYTNNSVQAFLGDATKIRNLYLSKDSSDITHGVLWMRNDGLPVCLLSYLETISVIGFRGRESELSMIAYILKNAKGLKKISISEATSDSEANFEFREKILKFDQLSPRCEIIFCLDDSKELHRRLSCHR